MQSGPVPEWLRAMSVGSEELEKAIERAIGQGQLLDSAAKNIRALLAGAPSDLYSRVIDELVAAKEWAELNDRFYKTLQFGTGGLRGRTIGKIVTTAERGDAVDNAAAIGRPEFPCVGTNAMNFYNINRATRGLVAYLHEWNAKQVSGKRPKIVIAHDTRFFSKAFTDLTARVASENGCDANVFDGPRSTPELSFAVRYLHANAGIVITASHNPPHDNGYKVYFSDGAQVIEPHASGIIAKVNSIKRETFVPLPKDRQGTVTRLGDDVDEAYMQRLETLIVNRSVIRETKSLRVIYTAIHGTGAVIIKPMLKRLGFNFQVVEEQDHFDGAFPTVKSPNPENADALQMGIELAKKKNADLVIATDPDCDRVGVAIRTKSGEMKLLTGNQIGSLLAWYRVKTLFDRGVLNKENASRGVIIKTFVTTDLLKAIAEHYGLRCVETLTGFKYIAAKLGKYEAALSEASRKNYVDLSEEETRELRLAHSSFYIFGGEESYGYSAGDFVRDKDGNGSAIMFCEVAAYAKSRELTIDQLLDEIFAGFGYFQEKNGSLLFEGAEGAKKIARLVESYASAPPKGILGSKVTRVRNFATETIRDVEGDEIPKEKMSVFELEDRTRIAVRGSGTEPKIKYYLFAQERPAKGKFEIAELEKIKAKVIERLERLWDWLQEDAQGRLAR
ncbi:MAG TPA: phospho-sugar mutase [Chthoniobacterales bacterium]|nr:phospho-sugar mutase [Chthoniobacterales bacterium]